MLVYIGSSVLGGLENLLICLFLCPQEKHLQEAIHPDCPAGGHLWSKWICPPTLRWLHTVDDGDVLLCQNRSRENWPEKAVSSDLMVLACSVGQLWWLFIYSCEERERILWNEAIHCLKYIRNVKNEICLSLATEGTLKHKYSFKCFSLFYFLFIFITKSHSQPSQIIFKAWPLAK